MRCNLAAGDPRNVVAATIAEPLVGQFTLPVKTSKAYATNVPPAHSLHAAGSPVPRRRSRRGNDPALQLDSSQRKPHLLNDRILRRCDLPLFFFHGFAVLFFCFTVSAQKLTAMGDAVPHTPCPLFCKKAGQKTLLALRARHSAISASISPISSSNSSSA